MSALPSTSTYDEYLNEQLINCLNIQTNVIQNLSQYSQHISLQLFEIKNNVNILTNRILTLEQQQQQSFLQIYPPPLNPLLFYQSIVESTTQAPVLSFSSTTNEQPSRDAPFIFDPINPNNVIVHSDEDEEDEDEPYEPPIPFKPIVKLFPVEVKTGEEDENILFCERAKLYRYDSSINEMKERAIGDMKILQHKTTKLCRILMRQEQVLKVRANHKITTQMELKPYHAYENAYIWSAMDSSDGVVKHDVFYVRFKTQAQATKFEKIFNASKGNVENSTTDDDIILIGERKPTVEQIERAKKLQLPLTFYLYENKEPCKGCRGCREDSLINEVQYTNRVSTYNTHNFPSAFFPNGIPNRHADSALHSLMSMAPTWFPEGMDSLSPLKQKGSPPKDHRMIIKAKRSLPSNRLPPPSTYSNSEPISLEITRTDDVTVVQAHQKKSRNFSGYITEKFSLDDYATQMVKTIFDQVKQDFYKQIVTTEEEDNNKPSNSINSGFSFTNAPTTTDFKFSSDTSSKPLFENVPQFNFLNLFKDSSSTTTDNTKNQSFLGQSSFLSGTNTTNEEDEYEPTVTFKPIVTLSPTEVKTGEEDENILFCERAKLYRFDSSTNEMKERGIGEMKILQHKTTKACRILMRREQVLKICANHKITSQIELKPHHGSENAYIWSAMDFSDGETKHETLCVKFKTSDIAKKFLQEFNNAKIIEQ